LLNFFDKDFLRKMKHKNIVFLSVVNLVGVINFHAEEEAIEVATLINEKLGINL